MQRLPLPGPSALGHVAGPPSQAAPDFMLRDILERWAGSDDTLRLVMLAKTEEDKLKQEVMRLEIRRIEMEMLKEALRAGIQPSLVPQIFMGSGHASAYFASQAQAQAQAQAQQHHGHAQQPSSQQTAQQQASQQHPGSPSQRTYQPFKHRATQSLANASPRSLPKTEAYTPSTSRERPSEVPGSAPPAPAIAPGTGIHQDGEPGVRDDRQGGNAPSLFFHHWQPPQQGPSHGAQESDLASNASGSFAAAPQSAAQAAAASNITAPSTQTGSSSMAQQQQQPGSPTPRKKRMTSSQVLNPIQPGNAPSQPGRRSPSRGGGSGHARHRSEASILHTRFSEYLPPPPQQPQQAQSGTPSRPTASYTPSAGSTPGGPLLPPGGRGGSNQHQSSFMRSSERDLPQLSQQAASTPPASAAEIDQARKRKRGAEPGSSSTLPLVEEQVSSPKG